MTDAPSCPRCRVPTEPFALDRATTIDLCARCKGAWFDRGELAQALGTHRDLLDEAPDELPLAAPDAPLCPRCAGVCMVRVPFAVSGDAPAVDRCPHCEGVWTTLPALAAMRRVAASRARGRVPAGGADARPAPGAAPTFRFDDGAPRPVLTLRQRALAVPAALAAVALVRSTGVGRFFLHGIRVTLHELGHALAAWACGWKALPLPVGVTFMEPGRHLGVHLLALAACAAGAWQALRHRAFGLAAAAVAYGLAALALTWGLPPSRQDALVTWAGCAGEIALGAVMVALAQADVPSWPRWARLRWIALALGACAFVDASLFWREAARDWDLIPWDAALADTGDMTALKERHGWDERAITGRYTALAWLCLAAVLAAQGAGLARAWRRGATAGSPPGG